jgi:hypothetical protein
MSLLGLLSTHYIATMAEINGRVAINLNRGQDPQLEVRSSKSAISSAAGG